jgi:rhodanese-related sulfurtransferase
MRPWFLSVVWMVACGGGAAAPDAGASAAKEGGAAAAAPAGKREEVDIAGFATAHAQGVQVVDVRTDEEWAEGHVPGAVHVPIDELKPGHPGLKGIDTTKPVYFVCAVGGRSSKATDRMAAAGWHAVNVAGGTKGWVAAGHPLAKETP